MWAVGRESSSETHTIEIEFKADGSYEKWLQIRDQPKKKVEQGIWVIESRSVLFRDQSGKLETKKRLGIRSVSADTLHLVSARSNGSVADFRYERLQD